jgi:hypothetical protein
MLVDETDDRIGIICAHLFKQITYFGRIAHETEAARKLYESFVLRRAEFLKLLLQVRDSVDDRLAVAGNGPILYNTVDWPTGAPIGGQFDPADSISLTQHLTSYTMFWNMQLNPEYRDSTTLRILRAALWVCDNSGLIPAIDYIIDLKMNGFTIDFKSTLQALRILLRARRLVLSDTDIVDLLMDRATITASGWVAAEFREFDNEQPLKRPDLTDDLDHILERSELEIENVVSSSTYDEWIVGQISLSHLLRVTVNLLDDYELTDTLAYTARATRIEEIRADAGSFTLTLFTNKELFDSPYSATFTVATSVIVALMQQTEDWRDRILEERAVIPHALQDLLYKWFGIPKREELPPGWQRFSATLTPIIGHLYFHEDPSTSRAKRFKLEEVNKMASISAMFAEHGFHDRCLRSQILMVLCGEYDQPIASENQKTLGNVDESGTSELLAEFSNYDYIGMRAIPRKLLASVLDQTGLTKEQLSEFLEQLRLNAAITEISDLVDRAFLSLEGEIKEDISPDLLKLVEFYPNFHPGLEELAVRLDMAGHPEDAAELLVRAILLEPEDALRWQSFSVVLGRLKQERNASISLAISRFLDTYSKR